ncbi:MAG: (Fe-S)-binding protein [Candidatus Sericytochromatia bacterium]|nr:(Fe-S)-binding protein [Candidatus Sericytochromatia bacterium]
MTIPSTQDLLSACIHCGLCLPRCPTYRETGDEAASPRGRIYLMRALEEARIAPTPEVHAHLDSCVGCRACETACPAGVRYGNLLERARATHVEPNRKSSFLLSGWRKVARHILPHPDRLVLASLPGRLTKSLLVRSGYAPRWLPQRVRRALELLPTGSPALPARLPEWTPAQGAERGVVAFLPGCAGHALYSNASAASVRLLSRAGFRVWVPKSAGCCGALHLHEGDQQGAEAAAKKIVEAFAGESFEALITAAGGCSATLHEYGDLLPNVPGSQPLAERVVDLASFLTRVGLPLPGHTQEIRVSWHDPCHLAHGLGVREAPRALLASLPGLTFVELPEADWCCGGAGTYTLKQPDLSDRLLARKLTAIESTGAEVLLTANPPCLMQIERGLKQANSPTRLLHLAEFLDSLYTAKPS